MNRSANSGSCPRGANRAISRLTVHLREMSGYPVTRPLGLFGVGVVVQAAQIRCLPRSLLQGIGEARLIGL